MRKTKTVSAINGGLIGVLCLSVVMSGCSGGGVKRADKAVASAGTLKAEYANLKSQVDTIQGSLDRIVTSKDRDLRSAFEAYQAGLKKLNSQGKKIVSRSADLRKNSKRYISQWEKQMQTVQNPALREKAMERSAQASAQFEQARDELERIQRDYNKFATDLNDIKLALENDLNPAGVETIEDVITQAKEDAGPVIEDIDSIMTALDKITAALSNM